MFHRIWSPFDAPTNNYSGSIAGLTSDVFDLRKPVSGCSSFLSSQSNPPTQPESSPLNPPPTGTVRLRSEGSETPLTLAPSLYIYTFPSPFLDKPSLNLPPTSSQSQSPPPPRISCPQSSPNRLPPSSPHFPASPNPPPPLGSEPQAAPSPETTVLPIPAFHVASARPPASPALPCGFATSP